MMRDTHNARVGLALVAVLLAAVAPVAGQECEWVSGEGLPGTDGAVWATTTWDPDGPGPQAELLVAAGEFQIAGDVGAHYLAAWDGSAWQPLGTGMEGTVYALAVYGGELIAAGWFTTAGGVLCNNIARWDGCTWQALGSGTAGGSYHGSVDALTVYSGELIAGGTFTTAGGVTSNHVARWNGSTWEALGSGMDLYSRVYALTVYNGELIAGGDFTTAGGVPCNHVARWNGSTWQALGSGTSGGAYGGRVHALTVYNSELVVGGSFTLAGGVLCVLIACWDGSAWHPLGAGLSHGMSVYALTVYNDELIAAGDLFEQRCRAVGQHCPLERQRLAVTWGRCEPPQSGGVNSIQW